MSRNFYNAPRIIQVVNGAKNFSQIITSQFSSLGLTQPQAMAFDPLAKELESRWQQAARPETRTPVSIQARKDAMAAMKQSAVSLAKIIYAHPGVTNEQLVALGLLPRRSRVPIPPPTVRPAVDLVSVVGRTITVRVHDGVASKRRGKPAGVASAFVYSFVGTTYPSDPSLWDFQGPSTRTLFDFTLPDGVPGGSQVWVCAAWVNARGQTGPVSLPITTYVQGGGVADEAQMKVAA